MTPRQAVQHALDSLHPVGGWAWNGEGGGIARSGVASDFALLLIEALPEGWHLARVVKCGECEQGPVELLDGSIVVTDCTEAFKAGYQLGLGLR